MGRGGGGGGGGLAGLSSIPFTMQCADRRPFDNKARHTTLTIIHCTRYIYTHAHTHTAPSPPTRALLPAPAPPPPTPPPALCYLSLPLSPLHATRLPPPLTVYTLDGNAEGAAAGSLVAVQSRVVQFPPQVVVVVQDVVGAVVDAVAEGGHVGLRLTAVATDVATGPTAGRLPFLQRP